MSLSLFEENVQAATKYASRHSRADLPGWWELHSSDVSAIAMIVFIALLGVLLAVVWRARMGIAVAILVAFRRLRRALRSAQESVSDEADKIFR